MNSAIMMLESTARRFPFRTAVQDAWEELDFSELRLRGMRIGSFLLENGAPSSPVIV